MANDFESHYFIECCSDITEKFTNLHPKYYTESSPSVMEEINVLLPNTEILRETVKVEWFKQNKNWAETGTQNRVGMLAPIKFKIKSCHLLKDARFQHILTERCQMLLQSVYQHLTKEQNSLRTHLTTSDYGIFFFLINLFIFHKKLGAWEINIPMLSGFTY